MAFTVSSVELYQFRNYQHVFLPRLEENVIFVGKNAVGKTNLLEALHLVAACQSFRHATIEQLFNAQASDKQARVAVELQGEERQLCVELCVEKGKRQYKINGKNKRSADICGLVPAVAFTPDDLFLIKGSHKEKRAALDALGEQLRPGYQSVRLDWETVLRHKNRLLKEGVSGEYLASINEIIVTCGAQLSFYRATLFDRLAPKIIDLYAQLSDGGEVLTCAYTPSWELHGHFEDDMENGESEIETDTVNTINDTDAQGAENAKNFPAASRTDETPAYHPVALTRDSARCGMQRALTNRLQDELIRQRSIIGPHMDTITFCLNNRPAQDFASQGQQRTVVLAWKLAEVQLIGELLGTPPILLLDDVMSELDATRRAALEKCIAQAPQAFITTTNLGYFSEEMLKTAQIISLPLP